MRKVYLRPLREADAGISFHWRNDAEIWKYTGTKPDRFITHEIELLWIIKAISDNRSYRFAICLQENDIYIGNIQLTNVNHEEAEYHVFIGAKEYWGQGLAAEASILLIEWVKQNLSLRKIWLIVNPEHKVAIGLYEKLGFKKISNEVKMIFEL